MKTIDLLAFIIQLEDEEIFISDLSSKKLTKYYNKFVNEKKCIEWINKEYTFQDYPELHKTHYNDAQKMLLTLI